MQDDEILEIISFLFASGSGPIAPATYLSLSSEL